MDGKKTFQCSDLQELLDNPDSEALKQAADKHLKNCPNCREELKEYQELLKLLDEEYKPAKVNISRQQLKKIKAQTTERKNKSGMESKLRSFFELLSQQRFAVASFALIILVAVLIIRPTSHKHTQPADDSISKNQSFSLAENKVMLIYASKDSTCKVQNKSIPATSLNNIQADTSYQFAADTSIIISSQKNKITLSQGAAISFSKNRFNLSAGKAIFDLAGPHQDFILKTPLADIKTIGTKFSCELSNKHLIIKHFQGKIITETVSGAIKEIATPQTLYVESDGSFSYPSKTLDHKAPDTNKSGEQEDLKQPEEGGKLENSF